VYLKAFDERRRSHDSIDSLIDFPLCHSLDSGSKSLDSFFDVVSKNKSNPNYYIISPRAMIHKKAWSFEM